MKINRFVLRKLLKESKVTGKALADKAGLSQSAVSRLLRGERTNPDMDTVFNIASALSALLKRTVYVSELLAEGEIKKLPSLASQPTLGLVSHINPLVLAANGAVIALGKWAPEEPLPHGEIMIAWDDNIVVTTVGSTVVWRQRLYELPEIPRLVHNRVGLYQGRQELPESVVAIQEGKGAVVLNLDSECRIYQEGALAIAILDLGYGEANEVI